MTEETYPAFRKIPRLRRNIIVTEKIDGTNSLIHVSEEGTVRAGSRTKWITPDNDNHGFARWVDSNSKLLATELGPGHHYGEWWGAGIQRKYGLTHKVFSLFNTTTWKDTTLHLCQVVPVLYEGPYSDAAIEDCLERLRTVGSYAAPAWTRPEGVVIFHEAAGQLFKVLLEGDDVPKGVAA